VESRNQLGIYWGGNHATVVCLAQGREARLLDAFSVTVEGQAESSQQRLADDIARACKARKVHWAEAAVALDCASFMQHTVLSEFRDPRKIAATIRFDTEEALAADVSDVAVAFRIAAGTDEGASLDVFTARRELLSDIILSLQSNGIDPVSIDPDICCLSRYLLSRPPAPGTPPGSTLYALLSDRCGYMVVLSPTREVSALRTFLLGAGQDRNNVLGRETLITSGLSGTGGPTSRLFVFDTSGEAVPAVLGEKTGLPVEVYPLIEGAGGVPAAMAESTNAVELALACGAALALSESANTVNLRNDHMPYLGRKRRVQKAVRFLSIALTLLLLTVGVYTHVQLLRVNHERQALRDKFEPDYRAAMVSEKKLPATMRQAVNKLQGTLRNVRANTSGAGGDQASISAKLTLILQAVNNCAAPINLNIDSITVTGNSMQMTGDTSSRQNTVSVLREAFKKVGLTIVQENVAVEGNSRDSFSINMALAAKPQGS
jgi:type II secretory pathway component PulL